MNCYRCGGTDLPLACLWPLERQQNAQAGIVLRQCQDCGLEQNHVGDGETMTPQQAVAVALDAKGYARHR
jgi:hypothetical protein